MASKYLMAVLVKETRQVLREWEPGLSVEVEIVDNLIQRVQSKGVGFGRTEAHVLADVRAAMGELLHDLKVQV